MGEKRGLRALQAWCRKVTEGYKNVSVSDMSMSWKDGLAFCAIIHHFRPDLVDFDSLTKDNILLNNSLAFTVAEQSLGIPALLDAEDMVRYSEPDKLSIATYVSQYYQFFEGRNRGTASNNLHTNKLSLKRPFNERAFTSQALPAKIPGAAPRGFFKDDKCSVCDNRVFILERLMVDAKLYHRTCFTCNKCEAVLRPGAYAASDDVGKFECIECPRDEKISSPAVKDEVTAQSNNGELSKDSGNFHSIDSEMVSLPELKLSNSFLLARKQFCANSFDNSVESKSVDSTKNSEETSLESSLDEGLVMRNANKETSDILDDNLVVDGNLVVDDTSPKISRIDIQLSKPSHNDKDLVKPSTDIIKKLLSKEQKKLPVEQNVNADLGDLPTTKEASIDNVNNLENLVAEDVITPVNRIAYDFPESKAQLSAETPPLPSSQPPAALDDTQTPTNERLSIEAPPQKMPRKIKRLSVDISTLEKPSDDQPSALSSSNTTSILRSTTSLPIITSAKPLRKEISAGNLKSLSPSMLPPTKLTSPESNKRSSLELKGTYQSPLSGARFRSSLYEKQETQNNTLEAKKSPMEKPAIPEKTFLEKVKTPNKPPIPEKLVTTLSSDKLKTLDKPPIPEKLVTTLSSDKLETLDKPPIPEKPATTLSSDKPKIPDKPPIPEKPAMIPKVPIEDAKLAINTTKEKEIIVATDNQSTIDNHDDSSPFENNEPDKPEPKKVKVVVRVKPERPPKPVILKETPKNEPEYPDDLNPFGEEEEAKNEYPDDLNPFGDEDEDNSVSVDEKSATRSVSTHSLSKMEDYDSKLNPFGDSDDEDSNLDTHSLSKESRFSYNSLPSTPRSSSRQSRTLGNRKKKPAPLPPSLLPDGRDSHHSDSYLSLRDSRSPSRSSVRGSPRSTKKAAPKPPLPPPPITSTPKPTVQDISAKAQKEQNNKTMKELVGSVTPNINEKDPDEMNTFGYWKKKKRPAPSVPLPPRRQIKMIPVKAIQSELLEIEDKQQELEAQGRDLEMMIRDYTQTTEDNVDASVDEEELIMQLFELVNEKNILFRRQAELMYIKRSQSLEQEQADIEYQYRIVSSKAEKLKSEEEVKKEEHLLQRLIEIVELRNEIVESMDMDRLRVQDEDHSIQEQMAQRQSQMQDKLSPVSTSTSLVSMEQIEVEEKTKKEKKKHKLKFIHRDKSKDPKDKTKEPKEKTPKEKAKELKEKNKDLKPGKDESMWKFAKKDKKKSTT